MPKQSDKRKHGPDTPLNRGPTPTGSDTDPVAGPRPNDPIDAVDEQDRVVGTAKRRQARNSPIGFRTVHVIAREGQVVVLQRLAPGFGTAPLHLGSSVAGFLHTGETYEHAARRTGLREIGAELHDLRLLGKLHLIDGSSHKFVSVYTARVDQAHNGDPSEIAELVRMSPGDVDDMLDRAPDEFTATSQAV